MTKNASTRRLSHRQRLSAGASTIALMLGIGVFIIPPIGILTWEMNRYQFVQRQLEKLCDAASLAGATRMMEADTSMAPQDGGYTAQKWRHLQGIEAAKDFIEGTGDKSAGGNSSPVSNTIVSVPITPGNSTQVVPGAALSASPNPNTIAFKVFPADPSQGYAEVPVGSMQGTSISVNAYFTEVPAFAKYLGLGAVPVYATSTSATPYLDVMVALDASGSMDDGSFVTFVTRMISLMPSAVADINSMQPLWPPPNPDYIGQCGPNSPPGCGCSTVTTPYTCQNTTWYTCAYNYYTTLSSQYTALQLRYNDDVLSGQYLSYQIDAEGELYDIVDQGKNYPYGYRLNCIQETNEYLGVGIGGDLQYIGPSPWSPSPPCKTPNVAQGYTDLVANLGPFTGPQPNYGEFPYTGFSYVDQNLGGAAYSFPNIPTLVDAAAGRLENPASPGPPPSSSGWKSYIMGLSTGGSNPSPSHNNTPYNQLFLQNTISAMGGTAPPESTGYQQAYWDFAQQVYQPQATVTDAAISFVHALQGAGKNIRVGFVAFDHQNAGMAPPYTGGTPALGNGIAQLTIPPVAPDVRANILPSTDLLPTSDPVCMQSLTAQLQQVRPSRLTDIGSALDVCRDTLLRARTTRRAVRQTIILITDGVSSTDQGITPPVQHVQAWGSTNDIPVYCVGLGATNNAIIQLMNQQLTDGNPGHDPPPGVAWAAGNGSIYYPVPTSKQLREALLNIARRLVRLAA